MSVVIKVDTREPMLAGILASRCEGTEGNIRMVIEQLDVGDVQIVSNSVIIMIERKTCHDMAASVKDGRYREQKARLMASGAAKQHILYVMEGVPSMTRLLEAEEPIFGVKPCVLSGMMVNTMLRDGLHVVPVASTEDTAAWVWAIAQRCLADPDKFLVSAGAAAAAGVGEGMAGGAGGAGGAGASGSGYLQHIHVKKRDNITPASCYVMQLCQVPGISVKIAEGIVEKFPTMLGLLNALSGMESDKQRLQCLSDIPMIGKKKAQVLLSYLLPDA